MTRLLIVLDPPYLDTQAGEHLAITIACGVPTNLLTGIEAPRRIPTLPNGLARQKI